MHSTLLKRSLLLLAVMLFTGCAAKPFDYTAYREMRPRSILVLPPLNNTNDINATYSMYSQITFPLAESGYYVFSAALVNESFKQNGLTTPADIHDVSATKLQEIFGADSALYITITQYGATYIIINSVVVVTAEAKLIDLRSGKLLWEGTATASNNEGQNKSGGSLVGLLVEALVKQVVSSVIDESHTIAGRTSQRLLSAGTYNGLLYGPYSPKFGTD